MDFIKNLRIGGLFVWVAAVILGIVLVVFPTTATVTICYLFGAVLVLAGLVKLISHFAKDENKMTFQFDLLWSVIAVVFGVLLLIQPVWFLTLLNQAIGLFIIIEGLFSVRSAVEAKRHGMSAWWILLLMAVASCVFGILLIVSLLGTDLLMIILGISLIISGVRNISLTSFQNKTNKKENLS